MRSPLFPHRSTLRCPSCSAALLCCYSFSAHSETILRCTSPLCLSREAELGAHGINEAEAFQFLKANVETEGNRV